MPVKLLEVSTTRSSVLTMKSPAPERTILKLLSGAGVAVIAPVLIKEGVETELEDKSLVAERVSVEKVRSASSESRPPVPANGTRVAVRAWTVTEPRDPAAEKRFVEEAVVEKKLVVVALVPVAVLKVKFWRVVLPVSRRLPFSLTENLVDEATFSSRRLPVKPVSESAPITVPVVLKCSTERRA